jgi:hypothetical protein
MQGSWLGFVELILVFGVVLLLGLRELYALRRERLRLTDRRIDGESAAARHAEGKQDLDPAAGEPLER